MLQSSEVIWVGNIDGIWYQVVLRGSITYIEELPKGCIIPKRGIYPVATIHSRKVDDPSLCAIIYQMAFVQEHKLRISCLEKPAFGLVLLVVGAVITYLSIIWW